MTEGYSPLDNSIAKGIYFLHEHQLKSGDLLFYSGNEDMKTNNL